MIHKENCKLFLFLDAHGFDDFDIDICNGFKKFCFFHDELGWFHFEDLETYSFYFGTDLQKDWEFLNINFDLTKFLFWNFQHNIEGKQ